MAVFSSETSEESLQRGDRGWDYPCGPQSSLDSQSYTVRTFAIGFSGYLCGFSIVSFVIETR